MDLSKQGNYDVSNAVASMIISKNENDPDGWNIKAHNFAKTGNFDLAYAYADRAIEANPMEPNPYADRAMYDISANGGKPTTQSKADAQTYVDAVGGVANGDEDKAFKLSKMYAILGKTDEAKAYQANYEALKTIREGTGKPPNFLGMPDWLLQSLTTAASPITMANEQAAAGLKTIVENVPNPLAPTATDVTEKIPKMLSGGIEAGMGFLGLTDPHMAMFNTAVLGAEQVGADKLVNVLTAPVTTAYKALGGDPEKLNEWAKIGFQGADMTVMAVSLALMKGGGKIGWNVAKKLFYKEPLKPVEAQMAVKAADNLDVPTVDQAMELGKAKLKETQTAEQIDQALVDEKGPVYRLGTETFSKELFLKKMQENANNGIKNINYKIFNDPETQGQVNEMLRDKVKPEDQPDYIPDVVYQTDEAIDKGAKLTPEQHGQAMDETINTIDRMEKSPVSDLLKGQINELYDFLDKLDKYGKDESINESENKVQQAKRTKKITGSKGVSVESKPDKDIKVREWEGRLAYWKGKFGSIVSDRKGNYFFEDLKGVKQTIAPDATLFSHDIQPIRDENVTSGGVRVGGMILKSEGLDENTTTGRKLALRQAENQVTDEIAKTPERQAELEKAITGEEPPTHAPVAPKEEPPAEAKGDEPAPVEPKSPEVKKELDEILKYRDNEIAKLKKQETKTRKDGKEEIANLLKGQIDFYENVDIEDFKRHFAKNPKYYTESNIDPFLRYQNRTVNLAGSDFPMINDISEAKDIKTPASPLTPTEVKAKAEEAPAKPTKEKASTKFVDKPVNEIKTDESKFQNRTELDQDQLKQIKDNWNDNELDPVVIWKDKEGKSYLLAGHHRLEAAKQLGKKTIPARYFEGTEEEAIKYAKEKSNANRTMEQPYDRAKIYRKMREEGKSNKEIKKALEVEGKNKNYVENLGYLNPKGKVMSMLKSLGKAGDKQTVRITEQAADWIGEARSFFSELTDAHENELYDWLINKGAISKVKTKTEFIQRLSRVADAMRMNPDQPLNLEQRQTHGPLESEKNSQINSLVQEIKDLEKERKDPKAAVTETRLNQITDELAIKNKRLGELKKELITAKEGDKAQTDIFSQINESIEKGEITDGKASEILQSEDTGKLQSAVEAVEGKANSPDEVILNEAVQQADEIVKPAEEPPKVEKPIAAKAKKIADKVRKGKIDDDILMAGVPFAKELFNGAVETAARTIELGGDVAQAVSDAINHIKKSDWYKGLDDEKKAKAEKLVNDAVEKANKDDLHLVAANAFVDAIAEEKFGVEAVQAMIDALPKGSSANEILGGILKNIDTKKLEENRKNILDGNRTPTKESQAMAAVDLALLKAKDLELRIKKQKAIDDGASAKELSEIDSEILQNDHAYRDSFLANRVIGTEWGQFGQFRGELNKVTDDYNIADMEAEYKTKNDIKGDLTDEQKARIKEQYDGIKDAEANLEKIKQQEAEIERLKTDKENQQKTNDELNKIIENYKNKAGKSKEATKDKVTKIDAKITKAKQNLKMLTYGRATSLGVLNPEIYKAIGEILSGKVEKFYEETKGKIELKKLLDETLKEAQEYMPDLKRADIEDALSGNYKRPKQTKSDLTKAKAELKKEVTLRKAHPEIDFPEESTLQDVEAKIEQAKNEKKAQKEADNKKTKEEKAVEKKAQQDRDKASRLYQKKKAKLDKDAENLKYEKEKKNKEILKRRYRQIQQVESDIQNKRYEKEEPKVFRKSDAIIEAERVLERRKQLWSAARKTDMMKKRSIVEKVVDMSNEVIRAFNLSFAGTMLKLGGVVAHNLITKVPRTVVQKGVMQLMPKEISKYGGYWGDVELSSMSKFYVDHLKVFRLETLKRVYGRNFQDPTHELASDLANDPRFKFLNWPGKTHQLIKEFIRSPELKFSENAQIYQALKNYKDAVEKLKDPNLTDKGKQKWQEQKEDFDVSNENVMLRISDQAKADASYQILLNNRTIGGKVKNAFGGRSKNAVVRVAQKVLWRSQNTIVTVPINYFSRYLYQKYGAFVKSVIGDHLSDSKQHVPGIFELLGKRMLNKDAFEDINLPPEVKREICKNVVNGSYTAMAMGMALLTYKNISYDRDKKQYIIYGMPVTEKILHLPLMDVFLSYATTFNDIEKTQGEATAKDYIITSLKNDYRQFKNMPFYNQLTYGYIGNVIDATKSLAKGTPVKAMDEGEKGFGKLISTYTAPPGFVREYAKKIDERIKNGEHLDPKTIGEMIKKDYPWISIDVPTKEDRLMEKRREDAQNKKDPYLQAEKKIQTKEKEIESKLKEPELKQKMWSTGRDYVAPDGKVYPPPKPTIENQERLDKMKKFNIE